MAEASRQQTAMQTEMVKQQQEMTQVWTEQVAAFRLRAWFPSMDQGKKSGGGAGVTCVPLPNDGYGHQLV